MNRAPLKIFLIAGESSGDRLGARLMQAMRARAGVRIAFVGVGGPAMTGEGLSSLFPMSDIAVMGIGPVLARLPTILKRIRQTASSVLNDAPDAVVLIDSPDFTRRVASRVRKVRPDLPLVFYVSPTVWAWRPGRAPRLARLADRLLALLPFEPDVHRLLGGPPTIYVGHPILERLAAIRPPDFPRPAPPRARPPTVLVLPGSRRSEVTRLMAPFGEALRLIHEAAGPIEALLPAVEHVRPDIERLMQDWPVKARIVAGDEAKDSAFRAADVALAASGTVTLELAMAGIPTVVAYRLDWLGRRVKRLIDIPKPIRSIVTVRSVVLPNLIAGDAAVPDFIDEQSQPQALAAAVVALLHDGPERRRQLAAFRKVEALMMLPDDRSPGDAAADAVLGLLSLSPRGVAR